MHDQELNTFKRDINLVSYAESFGYVINKKKSSPSSTTLKGPKGDKIIVSRTKDSWVYFSPDDRSHAGTIIDFHQQQTGDSLGYTRKALRRGVSKHSSHPLPSPSTVKNRPPSQPQKRLTSHPWLMRRAIGKEILTHPRFFNQVFADKRNNVVFPHRDFSLSICGLEVRNERFYGFSKNGTRGLWISNSFPDDRAIFVTESAIDAMSHFALTETNGIIYASTAGSPGRSTIRTLLALLKKHPLPVILSPDRDKAGKKFLETMLPPLDESQTNIITPPHEKDWNQELLRKG